MIRCEVHGRDEDHCPDCAADALIADIDQRQAARRQRAQHRSTNEKRRERRAIGRGAKQ